MRKFMILFGFVLVMAIMLAGCGGGDAPAADEPADSGDSGSSTVSEGDAVAGEALFVTCAACHGPDGKGLPNLGKDFTTSEFVHSQSDAELLAFVKVGRPSGDPANDTGVDMPPKGGNPALSDEDILDIIAYIRTIME